MSLFGGPLAGGVTRLARRGRRLRGRSRRQHPGENNEPGFITRTRSILRGDFLGRDHWTTKVRSCLSPREMHEVLLAEAKRNNGVAPVAARFQSKPERVLDLVPPDSIAGPVATGGILYRFREKPNLIRYPRPLKLTEEQRSAVLQEVSRLEGIGAIEPAPLHDGHKALGPGAANWEKAPMAPGQWPREQRVPVLNWRERARYDQAQLAVVEHRRRRGVPFRDFESTTFTVPKADGGFHLCTDYRQLNQFQIKGKFQLGGTKAIAQLIQPGDYGALVDTKGCFLEFGLHPAQRRHCRFRDPRLRRWQWRTMSFGMPEPPHLCTRVLRPFIGMLKGLGVRCSIYLDDLLVLSPSPTSLAVSMGVAMEMLQL